MMTTTATSTDCITWPLMVRAYRRMFYQSHVARVCPLPTRKLRKCVMRKVHAHRHEARKRFGL